MDIIDLSIQKGKHISGNYDLNRQTWSDFEKKAKGKKNVLFGVGVCSGYFFKKYGDRLDLEGVVDNDKGKQGHYLDEFIPETFGLKAEKMVISDISLFDSYDKNEIIVLVASINFYEEIIFQLEQIGIKCYFVLLIMEANRRKALHTDTGSDYNDEEEKRRFAKQCCEERPINRKKIFFRSYGDYTDHGKYITEALLKLRKDLDIVWAIDSMETEVPEGVRKIYGKNWKRFIYEMETSVMWIFDLPVPEYIIKRQGQLYLQTKHWASVTLKKFYLDASTFREVPERLKVWKREKKLIDHIITGSEFDTASCRRGFEFQGEVLQYGSPRSDGLFHEAENRNKVYEYYHLKKECNVLIYAPTYRFSKELGKSVHESRSIGLDFLQLKEVLKKRFGGEWYILVRLHPSVSTAFEKVEKPDFVIDASRYGDSQELVSASHILISDFSSIMFEAAFVNKPVFLFTTDLVNYLSNEYELLISYRELPFPVAESNEELKQKIMEFDMDSYRRKVESFLEKYGVHEDGHASDRTAAFISDWIQKHEAE